MEIANRPMTAWAPMRLLPELRTPNASEVLPSTTARLRACDTSRLILPMVGTDEQGGCAYVAAPASVVARGVDADHKFSTRLGPSASPPV